MSADDKPAAQPTVAAQLLLLLAVAAIGIWSQLWRMPLFDLDEGAFSEATREMVASGNYLLPTLNGEPRYDKPILIYWLQAGSVKLLGFNEFALRLPSAICATLWMLAVFRFTRRYVPDPLAAVLAASSVALTLMASIVSHAATADAVLNMLLALSLLDLYRYLDAPARSLRLRVFVWIGLGLLAKGPIAMLLPVAVSLPYALWRRQLGVWTRAALDPLGWLLLLGIVLPWVLLSYRQDGGEFLRHFLLDHNVGRYENTLQGHGGKPWYYLALIWLIVAPYTMLLVPALRAAGSSREPLDVFMMIWFLVVFVVFSFSATQLPHYLLYGSTPLFVLFGRYRDRLPARVWALLPALLLTALFAGLPWLIPYVKIPDGHAFERGIVELAASSFDWKYKALSGAACAAVLVCMLLPGLRRTPALIGAALAQSLAIWFAVVPVFAAAQQNPVRDAALRARELNIPVVSYHTWLPSFSVYRGAVTPNRLPQPGELVFVRLDRVDELERDLGGVQLVPEFKKGGVALFRFQPGSAPP
jgi:4-amino-4-deoxy-L-arabinose transferase-like glycosyltransferase